MQKMALKGFPLSVQQARLWAMPGDKQIYRGQCSVLLEGQLDTGAFQCACEQLVERHAILRSVFYNVPGMEVPLQVIGSQARYAYSETDITSLDALSQATQIEQVSQQMRDEPFDMANGPLLRICLLHLSAEQHLLLVSLPALCADHTTFRLLISELSHIYAAQGEKLAEEPLQYIDISAWQNELLQEENSEQRLAYWRHIDVSQLAGLSIPFANNNQSGQFEQEGAWMPANQEVIVEAALSTWLDELARHYQFSNEVVVLACWQILLWRLTGEDNTIVGVACEGRSYEELMECLGPCTRLIPFPFSFEDDCPFIQVLDAINKALEEAREEQYFFVWEKVTSAANESQGLFTFPVSFSYERWPEAIVSGGVPYQLKHNYCYQERLGLHLQVVQIGDHMRLHLHYDTARLQEAQIQRIATLFTTLLNNAAMQPLELVGRLPLLIDSECQTLLKTFVPPATSFSPQPWHRLVEAQAARTPTRIAVVCGEQRLSYQQLNEQANRLAWRLRELGVGSNVLVGLCMERSVHWLVGVLAVFKAGGAYLPLEPVWPSSRLEYALQETQAPVLLTHTQLREHLPTHAGVTLYLDEPGAMEPGSSEKISNLPEEMGLEDLAYVIYTSGSTGKPKGVAIRQSSLLNYTHAIHHLLHEHSELQWASVSTLAADLGHTVLFPSLMSGGCLHLVPYETFISGEGLARYNREQGIDVLKIVPTHLRALLAGCPRDQQCDLLPRRALILGGEALHWDFVDQLTALEGSCRVFNHYGPTETTVGTLVYELGVLGSQTQSIHEHETVPIGRPLANSEAYIVDRYGQLVPIGVTGDLLIAGAGLATGYLQQPEQTRQRFVEHPLHGKEVRAYHTGDLARYTVDGQIEYMGRADSQIKLRGYRIEPGEIEAVLGQHPAICESIILVREDIPGDQQMVAYVVANRGTTIVVSKLREHLQKKLPEYMIPSRFVLLDTLPFTSNGKLDRQALPIPETLETGADEALVALRSPVEELIGECWKDVLRIEEVGSHDNFFDKGGHSLLATQLISRVRASVQVEIALSAFFDDPTIAGLAKQVEKALSGEQTTVALPLVPVARDMPLPLSFAQQRLWFLHLLDPDSPAYNVPIAVRLTGALNVLALERSLGEIIRRHEILHTTFEMQDGQPVQVIHPAGVLQLPLQSLEEREQRETEAQQLARKEALRPFDLSRGPLLRVSLLRLEESEHILLLTMHHIVTDGWSNGVFIRELLALYTAFAEGKPSPLPELAVQYADFAAWQRQWLQGELLEKQLNYWKKQLGGAATLQLPTNRSRPTHRSYKGASHSFHLPEQLSQELTTLSRQEGVTLFMTLLAAFQTLFYRYTGQTDIMIGTDIANRTHVEIEPLIGFFINLLTLRTDFSEKPDFRALLKQVRETVLGAYAYQDTPFEKLVEMLQPHIPINSMPLVQVLFVLQNQPMPQGELPGLTVNPFMNEVTESKFDIALFMRSGSDRLRGTIVYNTDLFDAATIEAMARHLETLLHDIVAHPDAPVNTLEIYTAAEKEAQSAKKRERRISHRQSLKVAREEEIDLTEFIIRSPGKE